MPTESHSRKNIRLHHHDYSTAGAYFVTFCTHNRVCSLGEIRTEPIVLLTTIGKIVESELISTNRVRQDVSIDAYVIMPNHVHLILFLNGSNTSADRPNQFGSARISSLSSVIGLIKSYSTRKIREFAGDSKLKVWQERYYDRVIRNDRELQAFREYIRDNPGKWFEDSENPANWRQHA